MAFQKHINIVIVISLVLMISLSASQVTKLQEFIQEKKSAVEFLGVAGGKAFFRDATNATTSMGGNVEFCKGNDMHTASIETSGESNVITGYINSTGYGQYLWLGGWNPNKGGNWTWINNGLTFNFTNWFDDYPHPDRSCASIGIGSYGGRWINGNCSTTTNVPLCQITLSDV